MTRQQPPMNRFGQYPVQPNKRKHPWWIPITAGIGALTLAAGGAYFLLRGGESSADNAGPLAGSPDTASSAPQVPGASLSPMPSNPNISSASPSPSETTTTSASPTEKPDPNKTARQQAAHIITGCSVDFFSNSGVHKMTINGTKTNRDVLNLDITTDQDGSAADASASGLKTSGPRVVLRNVTGGTLGDRYADVNQHGNPGATDVYLPSKLAGNTILAVTIESSATVDGVTTTDTWLCGDTNSFIENLGGTGDNNWRPAPSADYNAFPAFTSVDSPAN